MIRAVLAVVLAVALLGISLPVVDDASRDRTGARLDRGMDRVADAATGLRADDPGPAWRLAPRRTVRLRIPRATWTTSGVESFRVAGGGPVAAATVGYDLPGRPPVTRRLDAPIRTPDGPIVLREPGLRSLRFGFVRRSGDPVVLVRSG